MADLVIEKINEVYLKVKTEPSIEYELRDSLLLKFPIKNSCLSIEVDTGMDMYTSSI
tara:strand:- start:308 stop:478 length:171 start_codon:yes stop_codon:yes gene_type:complete